MGEVGQEVAQAFTLVAMTMEATTAANFAMFTRPSFIVFSPAFPVAVALLWPSLEAPRLALEESRQQAGTPLPCARSLVQFGNGLDPVLVGCRNEGSASVPGKR